MCHVALAKRVSGVSAGASVACRVTLGVGVKADQGWGLCAGILEATPSAPAKLANRGHTYPVHIVLYSFLHTLTDALDQKLLKYEHTQQKQERGFVWRYAMVQRRSLNTCCSVKQCGCSRRTCTGVQECLGIVSTLWPTSNPGTPLVVDHHMSRCVSNQQVCVIFQ